MNKFTFNVSLFIISTFFLISLFYGFYAEMITGMKPLLYFIQLFVIFIYTNSFVKAEISKQKIINSWVYANVLGSLLLIQAFINGQQLQIITSEESSLIDDKSNLEYLFRVSYYYSGFIYLVGISIIVLFVNYFFNGSIFNKIFILTPLILLLLIALLLMFNKTIIFSIIISISFLLYKLISLRFISKKRFYLFLVALFILFFSILLPLLIGFSDENQISLMLERFKSSSSFLTRLEVYANAFKQWTNYPLQILLGMGPDFLDGSGAILYSAGFKKSINTGLIEGTVDSGWLSYLFELGAIAFLILILIYLKSFKSAYLFFLKNKVYRQFSRTSFTVYISLLFILLALTTQMLGYTKTLWFPFQLFIFGLLYLKELKKNHTYN